MRVDDQDSRPRKCHVRKQTANSNGRAKNVKWVVMQENGEVVNSEQLYRTYYSSRDISRSFNILTHSLNNPKRQTE